MSGIVQDVSFLDNDGREGGGFYWNSNYVRNMLRNYNSYNYIITLGILSREEYNDPNIYRSAGGFRRILLRSGGGALDKRIQTAAETGIGFGTGEVDPSLAAAAGFSGNHAEYFIEDLEIDSVVAPNPNTGLTIGTNVSFKVIEPYSMGKFIEALMVGAQETGHNNYNQMPLGLQIEFVGWNTPGQSGLTGNESPFYVTRPIYIPIMITKMDFAVTEKGSTYDISAISYADVMMSNNTDSLKTDIGAAGETVADVLQNTYYGLAETINRRYETLEEDGIIIGYDRYLILFPENLADILEVVNQEPVEAILSRDIGYGPGQVDPGLARAVNRLASLTIYDRLRDYGRTNINEIGRSQITESIRDGGTRRIPDAVDTMDLFGLTNPESVPNERAYQFQRGESISAIIQEVVLASRYAIENHDRNDPQNDGFRRWFRIKPMVFIDSSQEDSAIERQMGRPRRTYVYAVYPYLTHEARHLPASQNPRGIQDIRNSVRKIYNYIYTGLNEDVLNFEINFNYAYFHPAVLDTSNAEAGRGTELGYTGDTPDTRFSQNRDGSSNSAETREGFAQTQEATPESVSSGGTSLIVANSPRHRLAQLFHHRLVNSTVDMVTAELDIWGDPYFLPSDLGNYSTRVTDVLITNDETMPYSDTDVHIIVNFRTPIDYNDGLDGLMYFPDDNQQTFSGLYQVWAVTNSFTEGKFMQKLKLIRVINQNVDDPTDNTNATETASRGAGGTTGPF